MQATTNWKCEDPSVNAINQFYNINYLIKRIAIFSILGGALLAVNLPVKHLSIKVKTATVLAFGLEYLLTRFVRYILFPADQTPKCCEEEKDECFGCNQKGFENSEAAQGVTLQEVLITIPNGPTVSVTHLKKGEHQNAPTIIIPSTQTGQKGWMLRASEAEEVSRIFTLFENINVLLYDHPGVQKSTGASTPENLIAAGNAVYQYAEKKLATEKKNIHFYTTSPLAGFIGTQSAANNDHQGTMLINNASPSQTHCLARFFSFPPALKPFFEVLIAPYFWMIGYHHFNAEKALSRIKNAQEIVFVNSQAKYDDFDYLNPENIEGINKIVATHKANCDHHWHCLISSFEHEETDVVEWWVARIKQIHNEA